MNVTKENIYFLIETLRRNDYNGVQIYEILHQSWPNECITVQRIRKIMKEFEDGQRNTFERMGRSGRHKSEHRNENVDNVRNIIEQDSCTTVREISEQLNISHTMVHKIMCEELELIWHHTKWVPHTLTEGNRASRVNICEELRVAYKSRLTRSNLVTIDEKFFYCRSLAPSNKIGNWLSEITAHGDEPVRHTARRSTMERKFMAIIAVSQRGEHYFEILDVNESVNAERYIQFLTHMEAYFRNIHRPIMPENMRIQHDNARPHTSRQTQAHIENLNIRLIRQPAYSPDLNLCDRYVFPRLEASRQKISFNSRDDIQDFLYQKLPEFTAPRMDKALDDLLEHLEKVIENGGKYVT